MVLVYIILTEILTLLFEKLMVNLINCRTGLNQINFNNKSVVSQDNFNVLIDPKKINRLASTKFLGTYINEHLDWKPHISHRHHKQSMQTYY